MAGTLSERLRSAADGSKPSQPFVTVDGKALTYGDLLDRTGRLGAFFESKGLTRGDRLAVVSRDARWACSLVIAAMRFGLPIVNLNPDFMAGERASALSAVKPAHVFLDREIFDQGALPQGLAYTLVAASSAGGGLVSRLLGGRRSEEGLAADIASLEPMPAPDAIADDDVALMLFTSGTTSAPKVVQLTRKNIAAQLATFDTVYGYSSETRLLNPLPLHFTDGLLHGPVGTFVAGASLYRPSRFDIQQTGDMLHGIYRDRITHFIAVPALLSIIDRLADDFREAFQAPDFRYIRSSGDRLPEALWRSVEERFGTRIVNTYGLSETVCEALYCGPDPERFRHGTIGKPVDCEIRIENEDESGEGELQIRGDNIMLGYFEQPDLTEEAVRDGWFNTGDLARVDEDGFVTITGRRKALIISGGMNIQPQDIADAVMQHDGIAEAHAFGLPDPVWGETVACAAVARDAANPPSDNELLEHCRSSLAPHKVPRHIRVLESLPRNPAGKVLVSQLQDAFRISAKGSARDQDIEGAVLDIAAQVFGCRREDVRLSSEQRTTPGWDSFAHLNLVMAIEKQFGISMSPRDVLRIARLSHVSEIVDEHLAKAAG